MKNNIIILIVIIVILILFGGLIYYVFSNRYDVKKKPILLCKQHKCKNESGPPQVYNIKGNFTYEQANTICTEECGQLATINQLIDSYKKGAEWCNPSWSAEQNVLYPAQKKASCMPNTLPGINGGKQEKTKLYGANCYGSKPINKDFKPKCPSKKKRQCKAPLNSISPFNELQWSQF